MKLSRKKTSLSIFILVVLYTVGVVGIGSGYLPNIIFLTPLNLLISFGLLLWNHPQWSKESALVLATCFLVGLGIEVVGVQSGLIFGEYEYGQVLGWKVWGTPLMIGVNWAMLVYATGVSVNAIFSNWNWLEKALAGALLMLTLDYFIEPVAIYYGMWSWGGGEIPIQNYVAWFVISLVLLAIFHYFQGWIKNKVGYYLLIIQFLFFFILGQGV